MNRACRSIAAFACICLFAVQIGGLHLHVDTDGHSAGTHKAHFHQPVVVDHEHGHTDENGVALTKQAGFSWSKIVPLLFIFVIVTVLSGWFAQWVKFSPKRAVQVRHLHRWRPPLRAPPISS